MPIRKSKNHIEVTEEGISKNFPSAATSLRIPDNAEDKKRLRKQMDFVFDAAQQKNRDRLRKLYNKSDHK